MPLYLLKNINGAEIGIMYIFIEQKLLYFMFQFVELRNFEGGTSKEAFMRTHIALANEILVEVPDQLCSFMRKQSIHPKKLATESSIRRSVLV